MVKDKKEIQETKKDPALTWSLDKFTDSWQYALQNYHTIWRENWQLFNNKRAMRRHGGVIKTFVPMVHSAIITLVAAMYSSAPKFVFLPDNEEQEQETKILSDMMDDFFMRDGWAAKNLENGKNILVVGNGVFYYEYADGIVKKTVIPIRDAIIDPTATSWRDWQYAGRRYTATKDELKTAEVMDPKTMQMVQRFKNLDQINSTKGDGDYGDYLTDKAIKDMTLGQTAAGSSGGSNCEVIEIWTKKRVVTLVNRSVVIEDIENPHLTQAKLRYKAAKSDYEVALLAYKQEMLMYRPGAVMSDGMELPAPIPPEAPRMEKPTEGVIPFALGRDEIDTSLIYGSSSVDVIRDQQELLNDLTEMNLEAILYTLYPERTIDPDFATRIDNLDPAPGKNYPVPSGAMQWNNPPAIPTQAFAERANIKQEMREALSTDGVVKGVTSSTRQTATEIDAQMAQASQIIQLKARSIADDLFFQEGKIVFEMMRLYADEIVKIRLTDGEKPEWAELRMSDFSGNYTPKVEMEIVRESEKEQLRQAYTEKYGMIIQDPTNNLIEAKKIMYPKMMPELSEDEINRIITPAPTPAEEMTSLPVGDSATDPMEAMIPAGIGVEGAGLAPVEERVLV